MAVLLLLCLDLRLLASSFDEEWPITDLPPPERPHSTRRYAVATGVFSRVYESAAMTLCWSWRRAVKDWPSDVDLVVFVVDRGYPPPNATLLEKCFTRVLPRRPFGGHLEAKDAGARDALLALNLTEYARVLWLEADFIVARGPEMLSLVRTPVKFAAVQGLRPQQIWEGGLALVEPNPSLASKALDLLGVRICIVASGCPVNGEHVFVWLFQPGSEGVAVLPAKYDAEPLYGDAPAVREAYAVHFSGRKPWEAACRGLGAYGVWAELYEEAARRYGQPFPPLWAAGNKPTLRTAACGPRPDAFL